MFSGAELFESDISKWDVSQVTDVSDMFSGARMFESDISQWDVSRVTKMDRMFYNVLHKYLRLPGTKESISQTPLASVSTSATTLATRQHASRRPISERELVGRTPIATSVSMPPATLAISTMTMCPICGTFMKSGRRSCCAPGGAWFKNCGGARNKNVDHNWFEGVAACKRKSMFTQDYTSVSTGTAAFLIRLNE